jgi:hypothetical protein
VTNTRAPVAVWRSLRSLPDFWRLLELRTASQLGDGLFQAGLAGALLFNPERAAGPLAIAGAFGVLFLPYSLLGPFAGALMDLWAGWHRSAWWDSFSPRASATCRCCAAR